MTPLTDSERQSFHEILDVLLDERERIVIPGSVSTGGALNALFEGPNPTTVNDVRAAISLTGQTLKFARNVLGTPVHEAAFRRSYTAPCETRAVLRNWLLTLLPLLEFAPKAFRADSQQRFLSLWDVLDALDALDAGEIQPLFVANRGKARRANRYSLARKKVEALLWKKRLIALGHSEKSANFEITSAFGEQWDTVRKWRGQCEDILGETYVQAGLEYAGSERDAFIKPAGGEGNNALMPGPLTWLKSAGEAYRLELKRSSELSKRKNRTTPEN